jgi:hypothetical protein
MFFEVTGESFSREQTEDRKNAGEGEHLFIVRRQFGPKESQKTPGTYYYYFVLESVDDGGQVLYSMQCSADGALEQNYLGQGKWEKLASALGYGRGKVNSESVIGEALKGLVEIRNGYAGIRMYKGLWTASEDEKERAVEYELDRGTDD